MMNILQLHDDCLLKIIDKIKQNCESGNGVNSNNYVNLINFVLANKRFRHLFTNCYPDVFDKHNLKLNDDYLLLIINEIKRYCKSQQKGNGVNLNNYVDLIYFGVADESFRHDFSRLCPTIFNNLFYKLGTKPHILQLSDNCLLKIIDKIKQNCESVPSSNGVNLNNYSCLINFVLANNRFHHLCTDRYPDLADMLDIKLQNLDEIQLNFNLTEHYNHMNKLSPKKKEIYWSTQCNALESNSNLEQITIRYAPEEYNNDSVDMFNDVMDAIRDKRELSTLEIDMPYSYLNGIQYYPKVECLSLNATFDTMELAEYCESNPNLLRLEVLHNEHKGRITDIVPYCKQLEYLKVKVKCDYIAEYKSIANLPVSELIIIGEEGTNCSLSPLIHELVRKNPKTLLEIQLHDFPYNLKEIAQLLQLEALRWLILEHVDNKEFSLKEENSLWTLEIESKKQIDLTDLSAMVAYIRIEIIKICASAHKIGTLKPLFNAISKQESPQLTYFGWKDNVMYSASYFPILNSEEITELFKIRSLTVINFTVNEPFVVSSPLPKIKLLCINQTNSGILTNLFRALALQKKSALEALQINGNLSKEEKLEISKIKALIAINYEIIKSRDDFLRILNQCPIDGTIKLMFIPNN